MECFDSHKKYVTNTKSVTLLLSLYTDGGKSAKKLQRQNKINKNPCVCHQA